MPKIEVTLCILQNKIKRNVTIQKSDKALRSALKNYLKDLRKQKKSPGPFNNLKIAKDEGFAGTSTWHLVRNKLPKDFLVGGREYYIL